MAFVLSLSLSLSLCLSVSLSLCLSGSISTYCSLCSWVANSRSSESRASDRPSTRDATLFALWGALDVMARRRRFVNGPLMMRDTCTHIGGGGKGRRRGREDGRRRNGGENRWEGGAVRETMCRCVSDTEVYSYVPQCVPQCAEMRCVPQPPTSHHSYAVGYPQTSGIRVVYEYCADKPVRQTHAYRR